MVEFCQQLFLPFYSPPLAVGGVQDRKRGPSARSGGSQTTSRAEGCLPAWRRAPAVTETALLHSGSLLSGAPLATIVEGRSGIEVLELTAERECRESLSGIRLTF